MPKSRAARLGVVGLPLAMADTDTAMVDLELKAVHDVARAIGSADDLSVVLQGVAEAIAGGRDNRDVYVYIYDVESNELVLTGATESPAARQVGTLRVGYGLGVTGWVAASRQSYLIPDELLEDPHFLAYPGIGEEQYGAIFSVPIVSRADDLLGCITVWATNGHRFDPSEVPFVERMAALVAGTFETARLVETNRSLTCLTGGTAELASMIASGTPIAQTLDFATELSRGSTQSDVAVALVTDPSGADRMHIKAATPGDPVLRRRIDGVRHELLAIDQDIRHGRINWRAAGEQVTHALSGVAQAVTSAAVRVGSDELGMLACYRLKRSRFTTDDAATVAAIANHAAAALKLAVLSEELTERNGLNWFLREVSSGHASADELRRRASALGLDSAGGYVFVVGSVAAQPVPGVDVRAVSQGTSLEDLLANVPGIPKSTQYAVTAHQTVAIVPWTGDAGSIDALRIPLLNVCAARLRSTTGTALTFGVSRPVSAVDDFCAALAEAREAMAIGSSLANPNGVFTLDDVGHHLLLSRVSGAGSVRDRYATAIARIAEYDRVKGTELLDTLAAFLHFRSRTTASRELFVHRNTLNQRLTRASRLSGFDILNSSEWFPLQLALKVHQAKRGTAPAAPCPSVEAR
ncbi:hypothetical protein BH11ACT7_BH11ACT7_29980 [soil metagenome]